MRLINEDDVLKIVERVTNDAVENKKPKYLIQKRIIAEIAGLDPVNAKPIKYGKWLYGCTSTRPCHHYYCSECEEEAYWDTYNGPQLFDCCPSCGTEMRGEKS